MNKKIVALNEIDRYLLGEGYSDHQELVMTSEMISKPGLVNTEIYRFLINTPEAERAERIDELIVIMETPTELVEFRCGIARALVCVETEDEKLKERIVDALIRCVQAKESSGLIKCIFEDVFEEFLFSSVTTYSSDDVPVFQIDKKCRCEILNAVISFANNNLTSEEGKVATNLLSYAAMDREREGELVSLLIKLIQDQEAWEIDDADNLIGMARQMSDLAVVELSEVVFRDLYSQSSSSAKKRYSAYVLFHIGNKEIIQKLTNTLNQYLNQKSQNAKVVFETVMSLVRKMRTSKEDDLSSVVFEALEGEDCLFLEEFELEGIIKSLIDALLINAAYPDECVGDVVFQLNEMARGGEPLKTFIIDGLIEFFKEVGSYPSRKYVVTVLIEIMGRRDVFPILITLFNGLGTQDYCGKEVILSALEGILLNDTLKLEEGVCGDFVGIISQGLDSPDYQVRDAAYRVVAIRKVDYDESSKKILISSLVKAFRQEKVDECKKSARYSLEWFRITANGEEFVEDEYLRVLEEEGDIARVEDISMLKFFCNVQESRENKSRFIDLIIRNSKSDSEDVRIAVFSKLRELEGVGVDIKTQRKIVRVLIEKLVSEINDHKVKFEAFLTLRTYEDGISELRSYFRSRYYAKARDLFLPMILSDEETPELKTWCRSCFTV